MEALRDRYLPIPYLSSNSPSNNRFIDAECKLVATCDQGQRGGKATHLKKIVDETLAQVHP